MTDRFITTDPSLSPKMKAYITKGQKEMGVESNFVHAYGYLKWGDEFNIFVGEVQDMYRISFDRGITYYEVIIANYIPEDNLINFIQELAA